VCAPADVLHVSSETRLQNTIFKRIASDILVQIRDVVAEVCFEDIGVAILVVIGGCDAHPSLFLAIFIQGYASQQSNLAE
jgi:hypothetical protein